MPDPQRLLGIENEVLQFQFFPIVILIIFSRNANISFFPLIFTALSKIFFFFPFILLENITVKKGKHSLPCKY